MADKENKLEVLATLTEDCQHLYITHHLAYKRLLKKFIGKTLIVSIEIAKATRSNQQNRFLHGVVVPTVRIWLEETQGDKFTHDQVYTWLRLTLLGEKPQVKEIAGCEVVVMTGKRFSAMSVQEFNDAIEVIQNKMAERGCIIPDPTKDKTKFNLPHEFLKDD